MSLSDFNPQLLTAKFIVTASAIGLTFLAMYIQYVHSKSLEKDLEIANAKILSYQREIQANKTEYEQNLADANKTNIVIHTRFKERTKVIYQWGESNATDCNGSMYYLNNYVF